jgi:uncharacterized protein (DUF302 family)
MYGFYKTIHAPFDAVVDRVTNGLKQEGFGVLTSIDVRATLKKKLGVEMPPYVILGACNPPLAHRAIESDPNIGLLLPCNVIVREVDEETAVVGFMDPRTVLQLVDNEDISKLADEVRTRLLHVHDALK